MKVYGGWGRGGGGGGGFGGVTPLIVNHRTWWVGVVTFTSGHLTARERGPGIDWTWGWVGPRQARTQMGAASLQSQIFYVIYLQLKSADD
jgi:hypothetical protein